jgi:hypothetical protein
MHKLLACAFVGAAVLASGGNLPGYLTYVLASRNGAREAVLAIKRRPELGTQVRRAALLQEPDRRLLRALTA